MLSLRLRITGRVQGVGFRYAMRAEAAGRGVRGWVRNRADGSVEALVQGEKAAVDALVDWARRGPAGAHVTGLGCAAAHDEPAHADFELRPTV